LFIVWNVRVRIIKASSSNRMKKRRTVIQAWNLQLTMKYRKLSIKMDKKS
jgi:hypothetical protein